MSSLVQREDWDGLATLTLNRPDKLNALTVAMFQQLRDHVLELPQPVISAVHGHCYTGELALSGDMIVAAESAKFADTHVRWALTPVWGMSAPGRYQALFPARAARRIVQ